MSRLIHILFYHIDRLFGISLRVLRISQPCTAAMLVAKVLFVMIYSLHNIIKLSCWSVFRSERVLLLLILLLLMQPNKTVLSCLSLWTLNNSSHLSSHNCTGLVHTHCRHLDMSQYSRRSTCVNNKMTNG